MPKKKKGFWWKTDSFPFAFYQEKRKLDGGKLLRMEIGQKMK